MNQEMEFYKENFERRSARRSAEENARYDAIVTRPLTRSDARDLLTDLAAGKWDGRLFVDAVVMFGGAGWFGNSFVMKSSGGGMVRAWDEKYHDSLPGFAKRKPGAPEWAVNR